jgi:hypothetical protein
MRPCFNFAKGGVSADLKLEIDPIIGSAVPNNSTGRNFDFGADQVEAIEVKNAFIQAKKVFNYVDFRGDVFGYRSRGGSPSPTTFPVSISPRRSGGSTSTRAC